MSGYAGFFGVYVCVCVCGGGGGGVHVFGDFWRYINLA